jgi:hypothetical protein
VTFWNGPDPDPDPRDPDQRIRILTNGSGSGSGFCAFFVSDLQDQQDYFCLMMEGSGSGSVPLTKVSDLMDPDPEHCSAENNEDSRNTRLLSRASTSYKYEQ